MTRWADHSAGDFDRRRAPRGAARRAARDAEAARNGQAGLFFMATPTLPAEPAPPREELPGQGGLFGDGDGEDPCPCGDCRPDAHPPETMRPGRGHWECCGQAHRGPCCQRTGKGTAQ